jgi:hypothetical protein
MKPKRASSERAEHVKAVADGRERPDYSVLPDEVDLTDVVETHDVDPDPQGPRSVWATPDLADMARTNAIGGI